MSVRHFILVLAVLVVSIGTVVAGASPGRVADCLLPVDPYPGEVITRYTDQLHKRLEPPVHSFVQMLVMPAFQAEYCVSLHGAPNDLEFADARKFFLSYYLADKNIGVSIPGDHEEKQQKNVSISVITVEFPNSVAKRIYDAWRRVLVRTRYYEDTGFGPDPTTVEFFCGSPRGSAGMYGWTYDPSPSESAAYLIELGERLIDYCKASVDKRAAPMKAIDVQASALEKYLRTHPAK